MKKTLLTMMLMLVGMSAWAQDWTPPSENEYQHSTPVYVKVNVNGVEQLKAQVAAFIGDDCRAVSVGAETLIGDNQYHTLRVWGDPDTDANKTITFKVAWSGLVFNFTKTIKWTGETYNETLPLVLNVDMPTGIAITNPLELEQKLPFTYDLTNDIEFTYYDPSGADSYTPLGESSIESELTYEWDFANSSAYFTVGDNNVLNAVQATSGESFYLGLTISSGDYYIINGFTTVSISEPPVPVTGIQCEPSRWEMTIHEYLPRVDGLRDAIKVLPEDATNKEYDFVPADDAAAAVYSNGMFSDGGTYNINIVSQENPAIYTTIQVTVTVPVDGISLNTPSSLFYAVPGDMVYNDLRSKVNVSPSNATNKNIEFTIMSENNGSIVDGQAAAAGVNTIKISSAEDPDIYTSVTVIVNEIEAPEVLEMEIGQNYLDLLEGQIKVLPEEPNRPFTYTLSLDEESADAFEDDGTALTAGDYLLTVTCVENPRATAEVVVRVAEPVVITFPSTITLSKFKDTELELTLVSGEDNFDPELLEFIIEPMSDMIPGFDEFISYSPIEDTNNLQWNLRAFATGHYWIQVLYNGEPMTNEEYEGIEAFVPVEIQFNNNGWDWVYIPTGMSLQNEDGNYQSWMNQDENNRIIEIRSQTDLLYNDVNYGLFGTIDLLSPGDGMYKVKASYENAEDAVFVGDPMEIWWERYPWKEIVKGYNWIGYPNEWDMTVEEFNELENPASDGDVIIGKTGFAEFDGVSGEWVGSDGFYFQAGKGYLYYCENEDGYPNGISFDYIPTTDEQMMHQRTAPTAEPVSKESVWKFDAGKYADNMAMVAVLPQLENPEDYTIGAFVGEECRGKGNVVNGEKMMICVAGKAGETVTFRLHNEQTGEFIDINERVTYAQRVGSLKAPVVLTSNAISTGIIEMAASDKSAEGIFDLSGCRVEKMNTGGVYIVKSRQNGKIVTKKVVKK